MQEGGAEERVVLAFKSFTMAHGTFNVPYPINEPVLSRAGNPRTRRTFDHIQGDVQPRPHRGPRTSATNAL